MTAWDALGWLLVAANAVCALLAPDVLRRASHAVVACFLAYQLGGW